MRGNSAFRLDLTRFFSLAVSIGTAARPALQPTLLCTLYERSTRVPRALRADVARYQLCRADGAPIRTAPRAT
jgi:hypothetical protein